jgi:hypothetical protein
MQNSTHVTDGETIADLLNVRSNTYTAGRAVESPSNQTSALTVDQRFYTEIEYALTTTVNASDAYCFRVTNGGTPLDYYNTLAELGLQFDPTVSAVSFNAGEDIALISGTTTLVSATTTVTDFNGFADITHATATFYRTLVLGGADCTPNNNNCYVMNTASNTCQFTSCSGSSCVLQCTASVFFHADATDNGSLLSGEEWFAFIEVEDTTAVRGFNSSPGIELLTLRAIAVDNDIDYGALEANTDTGTFNPNTTVTNLGNVAVNIDIEGVDLSDGNTSVIPADLQKVATSTFNYSACIVCQQLSSSTPIVVSLNLSKPVDVTPPIEADVYWGIAVPLSVSNSAHNGVNIFTPIGL